SRIPHCACDVSVVVPTCRRPALLRRCLTLLLAQEFDRRRYEILVADDGRDAATERLVRELQARWAAPALRYLPVTAGRGPAAARNLGWRVAQGEIIAFTDDDCMPALDWLERGLAALEADAAGVAGRILMPLPKCPTDYEANATGLAEAEFVTANCFCRRSVLEAVGGFDVRFRRAWREDSDFFFTLLTRGERVVAAPRAVVVHPVRPAPWGVSLKQQRNALFESLLYKKHPALYWRMARTQRPWRYYAIVAGGLVAVAGLLSGRPAPALAGGLLWLTLTVRFCLRRLRGTSRRPGHVLEMALTSVLIPPLAIAWRLAGAVRHRVLFF
ncbi:MAG: glycosyltransferase family 2 protein, partial [Candidatus Methylomirabilales bacterium]